jgi:hypothetical protein
MNLYSNVAKLLLLASSQVVASSKVEGNLRISTVSSTNSHRIARNENCKDSYGRIDIKFPSPKKRAKKKTCSWVGKKSKNRCKYRDVAKQCPVTCGKCTTNSPTSSPTTSPTSIYHWCKDSNQGFKIHSLPSIKKKKKCEWAAERKGTRCTIVEVAINCPVLCDNCDCVDNKKRFKIAKNKRKSCDWLKKKKTSERCATFQHARNNCPLTCGMCETNSNDDTSRPSNTPTKKQSQQPSNPPTKNPTKGPTITPSERPSPEPSSKPNPKPSSEPSLAPSLTVTSIRPFFPDLPSDGKFEPLTTGNNHGVPLNAGAGDDFFIPMNLQATEKGEKNTATSFLIFGKHLVFNSKNFVVGDGSFGSDTTELGENIPSSSDVGDDSNGSFEFTIARVDGILSFAVNGQAVSGATVTSDSDRLTSMALLPWRGDWEVFNWEVN